MKKNAQIRNRRQVIYDVMYGFIPITEWEAKIIGSPFFQRLRWIKQLGFSNYIFPGAEHNRFAHVIGVMHSMDAMVRVLGIGVSQDELFDPKSRSPAAILHKSLRVSALLHDIGTFPFSHAIERAYLRHGQDARGVGGKPSGRKAKDLPNSHEHLGSFIIKNTRYEGGITQVLEAYGFDVTNVSKIIKGESDSLVANQLMHSDLDADRMDYLLRDGHYTGIKYGQFDRDYILANLTTFDVGNGKQAFGVWENAQHAVEDFLIARFGWYSQVIRNQDSAKFDIMSTAIAQELLDRDLMYQFQDLLAMVEKGDERFYWWNDIYFIHRCQEIRVSEAVREPRVNDLIERLLYRRPPKTLHHKLFEHRFLDGSEAQLTQLVHKIRAKVSEMEQALRKHGTGKEWILADIPDFGLRFTKPKQAIVKRRQFENLLQERDPVKIVSKDGVASLLVDRENSLMKHLAGLVNFIPSVYASEAAAKLLAELKLLNR